MGNAKSRLKNNIKKVGGEVKEAKDDFKKEYLFNLPTGLNALRIVLTFVVIYMIISEKSIIWTVVVFSIAAITDFLDGKIARKMKLVNPFGAKADMVADRVLWVFVAITMFSFYGSSGKMQGIHIFQLLIMMSREIIAAPLAIASVILGTTVFPDARYIAKITTFLQGFAFPSLMLSLFYPVWIYVSIPLSAIILVTGIISGFLYIKDLRKLNKSY